MLKHVTKLAMEIVPSVVATILGAYIVNHYINAKPDTPAAAVAAANAAADSSKLNRGKIDGVKADAKPAETSAEISNIPSAGIKAKGIAEKSLSDKAAAEKPAEAKSSEGKSSDGKSTETASLPAEKARAMTPKPAVRPAETPAAQEERRDAADLARAAIERLRASEGTRSPEVGRATGDQPRIVTAAPQLSPVRPLPPAIAVSTPSVEGAPYVAGNPPYTGSVQVDGRLTPPGEIPTPPAARPLDLRADRGGDPSIKDQVSNVAQDMVSAAKSVFHSVLPK
ncbi:MAG TPA: hypothetical protein VFR21_07095 [Bradyrhizobium sp.]|nr:hypothetical protein [Bradyrhizobium sp.]